MLIVGIVARMLNACVLAVEKLSPSPPAVEALFVSGQDGCELS
jgi:hypothetical protein